MKTKLYALTLILCALSIDWLFTPQAAQGLKFEGTEGDDTIYFGCIFEPHFFRGYIFQVVVLRNGSERAEREWYPKDPGAIYIVEGLGGNDHIEAVHNEYRHGYYFGRISNLNANSIVLRGGSGNDVIIGTPGDDILFGGEDNDCLYGSWGDDVMFGGPGSDFLGGEGGDDIIRGDNPIGDSGDDIIMGGTGDDDIDGGPGSNNFWCRWPTAPTIYDPSDYRSDYIDRRRVNVIEHLLDPYNNWVLLQPRYLNGITYHWYTTSGYEALLEDIGRGARIIVYKEGQPHGPQNREGEPLGPINKQYGMSCGPSSLALVMDYFGITKRNYRLCYPRVLSDQQFPLRVSCRLWPEDAVDVGHYMSTEHIIYEGYHRGQWRAKEEDEEWNPIYKNDIIDSEGRFITSDDNGANGAFYQIDYDIGNVSYNAGTTTGGVQSCFSKGGGVGMPGFGDNSNGLPYIANRYAIGTPDAMPLKTAIGPGRNESFESMNHLKAVIKGFIDHNIPLVCGVEGGGHFNVLIGYWERGDEFWVYTTDPLDGYGRYFSSKAMRWRKMLLNHDALAVGALSGLLLFNYADSGVYGDDPWARRIDDEYDNKKILTSHLPH
jgi:hypothetical protein